MNRYKLWISMCSTFQNKASFEKNNINSWQNLLGAYLTKKSFKREMEYINFMLANKEITVECAKDVYKLRTEGMEALLDPKDFELFYDL